MGQLTPDGFVVRRLDAIIAELDAGMKAIYGIDINTDPDSPDGQAIGLWSQALADLEELAGEMWRQMDPDYASGPNLDRIVAFAGIRRVRSSVSWLRGVILSGAAFTPINTDAMVRDPTGALWRSTEVVQLNANGSARLDFQSDQPGAYPVGSNVELEIVSGVAGWRTAVTSQASDIGADEEQDPALRSRFYLSRERPAFDDVSGMRANLLAVTGVIGVEVFENYGETTDANGVAPHSINAVVDGGDDEAIGTVILNRKPMGTGMQGEQTVMVLDRHNRGRLIHFDRPTRVPIYVTALVERRLNFTDIDTDAIARALASTIFTIGEPVIYTELYGVMYQVPGFIVRDLQIGTAPNALTDADIIVGPRDKPVIDAADVFITVIAT
ncbi:baseplate J/gp47 family protein [Paraburkholderia sp. BR10923]|uniref:baseplate J/gp47 family protein n=1 Tax=Paraburkholderia sp. BR10923 TaxID=3236992 RepID=UPI0034CD9508